MGLSPIGSAVPQPVSPIEREQPVRSGTDNGIVYRVDTTFDPNTRPAEATQQAKNQPDLTKQDPAALRDLIERANEHLQAGSAFIAFSVDPSTKQVVTTLRDARTNEVIRQIPSEAVIQIAKSIDRLESILVKERV